MRVAIVDDILESHVARSLADALRARGHVVVETGKRSHGPGPTRDAAAHALIAAAHRELLAFEPDVVLLMRPQSWPVEYSTQLRRSGARIVAWLSDDPVLFASGYGHVVESVDLVLHCGGERVIAHYDRLGLSGPGVNFPFWTGRRKPVTRISPSPYRGMFLGHLRGGVRARRLELLESLDPAPVIFGKLERGSTSPAWGGELRTPAEIERAAERATVGLNLPQQFADYREDALDFPGLVDFGGFETPSRVVQYAALGLAILTLDPAGASRSPSAFQSQMVTRTAAEFGDHYSRLDDSSAEDLGQSAHAEFSTHFTADRRAALLEALLSDDSWRSTSAAERAVLYRDFDGLGDGRSRRRRATTKRAATDRPLRRAALLGRGWKDADSHLMRVQQSLTLAGVSVHEMNPYAMRERLEQDPKGDFEALLLPVPGDPVLDCDALVLVGSDIGLSRAMWLALEARGVAVAVAFDESGWSSARRSRLAARADAAMTVRPEVAAALDRLGVAGRSRARLGLAPVPVTGSIERTMIAVTVGGGDFHGIRAVSAKDLDAAGPPLQRAVIDPALSDTPSATLRTLRVLRRSGAALALPLEVLDAIDVEMGPDDVTFGSIEELQRKLRAARQQPTLAGAAATMMGHAPRARSKRARLAPLLAAID